MIVVVVFGNSFGNVVAVSGSFGAGTSRRGGGGCRHVLTNIS